MTRLAAVVHQLSTVSDERYVVKDPIQTLDSPVKRSTRRFAFFLIYFFIYINKAD